jgi:pentose-5-phosphate-3-epimerase
MKEKIHPIIYSKYSKNEQKKKVKDTFLKKIEVDGMIQEKKVKKIKNQNGMKK